MDKVWVAVAASVLGLLVVFASGATVHFDLTHQNCSADTSIPSECTGQLSDAGWEVFWQYIFGSVTDAEYEELTCTHRLETIACVETAICHCNYSSNHSAQAAAYFASAYLTYIHNNNSICGNASYGDTIESDVFAPIDVTGGVDCDKYNKTVGDYLLSFETVNHPSAMDVASTCEALRTCYAYYDAEAAVALYHKDFHGYCIIFDETISCANNVSCACGQSLNETFIDLIEAEKEAFRQICDIVMDDVSMPYGVVCSDVCKSTDPMDDCYRAWYYAYIASETKEQECLAEKEWAYCIETLACECGFFNDSFYFRTLAISRLEYVEISKCENVTGPFPDHVGLNCTDYGNLTEAERFMIVSLASAGFVDSDEDTCPGLLKCYNDSLDAFNEGYRNKDIHAVCQLEAERYGCLEKTYCDCNLTMDENVVAKMKDIKDLFDFGCSSSYVDAKIPNFVCYGAYCESPNPTYGCLEAWYDAYYSSTTTEGDCLAERDWADCIEGLACVCGFHNQTTYYRTLARSKLDYENSLECVAVTGPFPSHSGLNCTSYMNLTEAERFFTLSLASAGFVDTEEARCRGILQCYNDSLDALDQAYQSKDIHSICQLEAERYGCVDRAYCTCELRWDPDAMAKLQADEENFTDWCESYHIDAAIPQAACYDCDTLTPENTCEKEWVALYWSFGEDYCRGLVDLANCTETVACACHFHNEPTYLQNVAIAKHEFDSKECSDYDVSFPSHAGYDCDGDQMTDLDRQLSIALSETDFVENEDAACPGVKQCYIDSDSKATEAYHLKDLTAICETEKERILCVEDKYCHCGTLFSPEVYNRTTWDRSSYYFLCYDAVGYMPIMKCRGRSACQKENPLAVCDEEFDQEYDLLNFDDYTGMCRAYKYQLLCFEEVGCQCGLLVNGSSSSSFAIYNLTTQGYQAFKDKSCNHYVGDLDNPAEDGIQCAGAPDDDTMRKLVLTYADSDEVAVMVSECHRVHKCFRADDKKRAAALSGGDLSQLCKIQRTLVVCLDEAYCRCNMNGTRSTEAVIATQMKVHSKYCHSDNPITRKKCVSLEADLENQCHDLKTCLRGVTDKLAVAVLTKNYVQYCQEKRKLIHCQDEAFCKCQLNGTENVKDYMDMEMSDHREYCDQITRKNCKTSAADYLHPSLVLAALLVLGGIWAR